MIRVIICLLPLLATAQTSVQVQLLKPELLIERLKDLPVENSERLARLSELFNFSGCKGSNIVRQPVKGHKLPNVICTLPGESQDIIVIGAHFDKVKAGRGTMDNGTGMLLLPALYLALSNQKRHHTFVFVGFTDEEEGLHGSRFFAKAIPKAERSRYRAMVNLDTLGLGPLAAWRSHSNYTLLRWLLVAVESLEVSNFQFIDAEKVGDSDSSSFKAIDVPVVDLHSITQKTLPILHSPNDNMSALQPQDYIASYRLIANYLAYLDLQIRDHGDELRNPGKK